MNKHLPLSSCKKCNILARVHSDGLCSNCGLIEGLKEDKRLLQAEIDRLKAVPLHNVCLRCASEIVEEATPEPLSRETIDAIARCAVDADTLTRCENRLREFALVAQLILEEGLTTTHRRTLRKLVSVKHWMKPVPNRPQGQGE